MIRSGSSSSDPVSSSSDLVSGATDAVMVPPSMGSPSKAASSPESPEQPAKTSNDTIATAETIRMRKSVTRIRVDVTSRSTRPNQEVSNSPDSTNSDAGRGREK